MARPHIRLLKDWKFTIWSVYLLVEAMLLFNDKCVVQTPGNSSKGTEQGGKGQEHKWLDDLILWTKSKASCHRTCHTPQKRDSTQKQDQLKNIKIISSFQCQTILKKSQNHKQQPVAPKFMSLSSLVVLPSLQSQSRVQTRSWSYFYPADRVVTFQMFQSP